MMLFHYRYLMGDWWRVNLPLIRFKPNPVIVRSDSQSGNAIQELIKGGELNRIHLFGKLQIDAKVMSDDPRGYHRRDSRWGDHNEAAKSESLAYSQCSPRGDVVLDNETGHRALRRGHRGTLNESTNVGEGVLD